jgi:hypothetical protein
LRRVVFTAPASMMIAFVSAIAPYSLDMAVPRL